MTAKKKKQPTEETSTEIAVQAPPSGLEITSLRDADVLAQRLAGSGIIPGALRGKPADVLVVLMTGHELGLSPMQSLRMVHVFDGKPILGSELIVGLVKKSPECLSFQLVESSNEAATYKTQRRGEDPTTLTWTLEQAQAAGLAGRDNWKRHPAAMLRARAAAALARAVYPDITLGILETDEAAEIRAANRAQQVEGNRPPPASAPSLEEQPVDAEIVELEPGLEEQAAIDEWTERIQGALDEASLKEMAATLRAEHPDKDSSIRRALREVYKAAQEHLRERDRERLRREARMYEESAKRGHGYAGD